VEIQEKKPKKTYRPGLQRGRLLVDTKLSHRGKYQGLCTEALSEARSSTEESGENSQAPKRGRRIPPAVNFKIGQFERRFKNAAKQRKKIDTH